MGHVIAAVLGIVALYLVVWAVVSVIVLYILPGYLVVLAICLAAGLILAPIMAVLTLTGAGVRGPRTVTPEDVASGAVRIPWRKKNNPFKPDPAWPSYLVVQWRVDLQQAWRNGSKWLTGLVQRLNDFTHRVETPIMWSPLLLFLYSGWVAAAVGALLGGSALVTLAALVIGPAWLGSAALIGMVRSVDALVRKRRKATGSCAGCYYVTTLPAYKCDRCQALHRDLRPGWQGTIWHKCGCGRRLPTTVLRATKRLTPRCPRCGKPLCGGAGALTDIRLPVFGPMSAGKTRLVYAAFVALRNKVGKLTFTDEWSKKIFDEAAEIIASGANTQKTRQDPPRPITAQVTLGRRTALLHLFDAAGEYFIDREDNSKLEFLDTAQGLVFVVDPFSVNWVANQLTETRLLAAHPAREDPERVYHLTVRRLAEYGVPTKNRHLAIAVVKSDLLIDLPLAKDLRTGNARIWLEKAGLDHLTLSAERDFANVRYFTVASVANKPDESLSPATPFMWLMSTVGFPTRSEDHHEP